MSSVKKNIFVRLPTIFNSNFLLQIMNKDIMYSVFEVYGDVGKRSAFGAPDNWEVDGQLKWPKTRNMNFYRKKRFAPDVEWESTSDYRVLARNLRKMPDSVVQFIS